MKKLVALTGILIALVCIAMSCGKEDLYASWGKSGGKGFSDSLSIKIGKTAMSETGDKLSFLALVEDSRCPANAMCIWQGMVEVELKLKTADGEQVFRLNSDPDATGAGTASVLGYDISLVNVLPYPGTYEEANPEDFWVELAVKKSAD